MTLHPTESIPDWLHQNKSITDWFYTSLTLHQTDFKPDIRLAVVYTRHLAGLTQRTVGTKHQSRAPARPNTADTRHIAPFPQWVRSCLGLNSWLLTCSLQRAVKLPGHAHQGVQGHPAHDCRGISGRCHLPIPRQLFQGLFATRYTNITYLG